MRLLWLLCAGLDIINMLTKDLDKRQELRVELQDLEGNKAYALYDNFVVGNEGKRFKLESVGKYTGNAG